MVVLTRSQAKSKQQATASPKNAKNAIKAKAKKSRKAARRKSSRVSADNEMLATPQMHEPMDTRNLQRSAAPSPPTLCSTFPIEDIRTPPLSTNMTSASTAGESQLPLHPTPSRSSSRARQVAPHLPARAQPVFNQVTASSSTFCDHRTNTPQAAPPSFLLQAYATAEVLPTVSAAISRELTQFVTQPEARPSNAGFDAGEPATFLGRNRPPPVTQRGIFGSWSSDEGRAPPPVTQGFRSGQEQPSTDVDTAEMDGAAGSEDEHVRGMGEYYYRELCKFYEAYAHPLPRRPSLGVLGCIVKDEEYRNRWFSEHLRGLEPDYANLPDLSQVKWRNHGFTDGDDVKLGDEGLDRHMEDEDLAEKDHEMRVLTDTIVFLCGAYTGVDDALCREMLPDIREDRQRAQWYRRLANQERAGLQRIGMWAAAWNSETKGRWSVKEMWTRYPFRVKKKDDIWRELASDEERGSEDSDFNDDFDPDPPGAGTWGPAAGPSSPPSRSQSPEVSTFRSLRSTQRSPPPPQRHSPVRRGAERKVTRRPRDRSSWQIPFIEEDENDDVESQPAWCGGTRRPRDAPSAAASSSSSSSDDLSSRRRPAYGVIRWPLLRMPPDDDISSDDATIGADHEDVATLASLAASNPIVRHYLASVADSRTSQDTHTLAATAIVANGAGGSASTAASSSVVQMDAPPVAGSSNVTEAAATAPAPRKPKKPHRSPQAYVHWQIGEKRGRNPRHPGTSSSQPELNPSEAKRRRIRRKLRPDDSDEAQFENYSPGLELGTSMGDQDGATPSSTEIHTSATASGSIIPGRDSSPRNGPSANSTPAQDSTQISDSPLEGMDRGVATPSHPSISSLPMPPPGTVLRHGRTLSRYPTPSPQAQRSSTRSPQIRRSSTPSPQARRSQGISTPMTAFVDRSEGRKFFVPTDKLEEKLIKFNKDTIAALNGWAQEEAERFRQRMQVRQQQRQTQMHRPATAGRPAFMHGFPTASSTPTRIAESSVLARRRSIRGILSQAGPSRAVARRRGLPLARQRPRDIDFDWCPSSVEGPLINPPSESLRPGEAVPLTLAHLSDAMREQFVHGKPKTADELKKSKEDADTQQASEDLDGDPEDEQDSTYVEGMLGDGESVQTAQKNRALELDFCEMLAIEEQMREEAETMAEAAIGEERLDPQDEVDMMLLASLEDEERTPSSPVTFGMRTLPFWENQNVGNPSSEDDIDMDGETDVEDEDEPELASETDESGPMGPPSEGKGKGRADGKPTGTFTMTPERVFG